ncbi:hypothetical protein ACJMK2_012003 [Sinanodonta woodiana]|uniref:GAR domain-containing protein n=1 Tax=Sinanodonta woodiana TaxID=1069815 RepID=A0ABD3V761_SINWO
MDDCFDEGFCDPFERLTTQCVKELAGRCTCPVQFPIIKVGEGKYKIGDSQTLVFVRILRNHVMIRVGGGWDTLEHYLDRHDPCRCNFAGHRAPVGHGANQRSAPATPRRSSTPSASQSLPNTPRTTRKLSLANTYGPSSSQTPRPASPGMRSLSPGPSSRKLPQKPASSQPSSTTTSPAVNKQPPKFPTTGNTNSGSTPANKHQRSTPVSSATQAGRQSPALKRSPSPAPSRLRSPSPVPSNVKTTPRSGSQPARPTSPSRRCTSPGPLKKVTLSEVRSSRDQALVKKVPVRRQASVETSSTDADSDVTDKMSDSSGVKRDLSIDQISTMTLEEFRNLLNKTLSVPNGTDSQYSSESPRSQSSSDSFRNQSTFSAGTKKGPIVSNGTKVRSISATGPRTGITESARLAKTSTLDNGSSGYSSSSISSDKSKSSIQNLDTKLSGQRTEIKSSDKSTRPKTPLSVPRPTLPVSTYATNHQIQNTKQLPTASIDQTRSGEETKISTPRKLFVSNSLDAFEKPSFNSQTLSGTRTDIATSESTGTTRAVPAFVRSNTVATESHISSTYSKTSAGYTPRTAEEKQKVESSCLFTNSAISERKETNSVRGNVGYVTLAYEESEEMSKLTNGLYESSRSDIETKTDSKTGYSDIETDSYKQPNTRNRSNTPVGRPSTPSLIPRPATHSLPIQRMMSESDAYDSKGHDNSSEESSKAVGRPPTPRKTSVIAKASTSRTVNNSTGSQKERSYTSIFQSKRSTTPGPGNRPSTPTMKETMRRTTTPGPDSSYIQSVQTVNGSSKEKVNDSLELSAKEIPLSDYSVTVPSDAQPTTSSRSSDIYKRPPTPSSENRNVSRQSSISQPETVLMINRADGHHKVNAVNEQVSSNEKSKVLARARTTSVDHRDGARSKSRIPSTADRPRPQSVEPKRLHTRQDSAATLSVHKNSNDRTEAWVESTAARTTTSNTKKISPKSRRSMTPNSFRETDDEELLQSRSLDEIKAALTLPINGVNKIKIDTENLEAPPEDPEMYETMERLFQKLREKELRASVNETPGGSDNPNGFDTNLPSNQNVRTRKMSSASRNSASISSPSPSTKKTIIATARSRTPSTGNISTSSAGSNSKAAPHRAASTPPRDFSKPPRPTSTPPRPNTPTRRQNSKSSDENAFEIEDNCVDSALDIVSKLKEVIQTKPRKDKSDAPKTRIPAPAFLSQQGRSKSFSNISSLAGNMSYSRENGEYGDDQEMDKYSECSQYSADGHSSGGRCETPAPKVATPLTTGRSTLLRKDRADASNGQRLVRAVSVERNLSGLSNVCNGYF